MQGTKAVECFEQMVACGVKPNAKCFQALLLACAHSGLTTKTQFYYDSMQTKFNIFPKGVLSLFVRSALHWSVAMIRFNDNASAFLLIKFEYFKDIEPDLLHVSCVVDAQARHGSLDKAEELLKSKGPSMSVLWMTILGALRLKVRKKVEKSIVWRVRSKFKSFSHILFWFQFFKVPYKHFVELNR